MRKTFGEYKLVKIDTSITYEMAYAVTDYDGDMIGFVSKFKDTRTEIHPWKAWGAAKSEYGHSHPQFSREQFDVFYEWEGGLAAAVAKVIEFAKERQERELILSKEQ